MCRSTARARTGALLSAALAACAHPVPNAAPTMPGAVSTTAVAPATVVALRIENHQSNDVVIYAAQGRTRQRLGTVTGATTRTISIPHRFAADPGGFYLVAHVVGGPAGSETNSPTVTVQSGQTVVWTLESELQRSSLAIE